MPVINSLTEPVVLPKRFVTALFETVACSEVIAELSSSSRNTLSPLKEIIPSDISQTISEEWNVPEQQLLFLLHSYAGLFDRDGSPLEVARGVQHHIYIGYSRLLQLAALQSCAF